MSDRTWPKILVMGYSEAGMFIASGNSGRVGAIVSIHGAREYGVESSGIPRVDLSFDDVDSPPVDDVVAIHHARVRQRWEREQGLVQQGPTIEDARVIVKFARRVRSVDGAVLCHCGGGISWGPATAILCLAAWMAEGNERVCVEEVLRVRPAAQPHADVVRFGDEVLGRGGKLVAALNEIRAS